MQTNLRTTAATFLAAALLATATGTTASAKDLSPAEILQRMDQAISGYADQAMDVTMTIIDASGARKSYDFGIQQKGLHMRMIRMLSGELKGMSTLVEGRDRIYVYLPGFKKVRRVAAHNMGQSFAGSDFSNDDLAFTSWPGTYVARMEREDDDFWYLRCTPKAGGSRPPYPQAIARVDKKNQQMMGYTFLDEAGNQIKTFDLRNLKDWGGGALRTEVIEVTDNRSGHKTRLDLSEFKVNQGLKDSLFTERELEWGR